MAFVHSKKDQSGRSIKIAQIAIENRVWAMENAELAITIQASLVSR